MEEGSRAYLLKPDAAAIPGRIFKDRRLSVEAVGLISYVIYVTKDRDLTWGEIMLRFDLSYSDMGRLNQEIEAAGHYSTGWALEYPGKLSERPPAPEPKRKRSSIYVITDDHMTKVGISRKVKRRLSVIRTSCSNNEIRLAFSQEDDADIIERAEAIAHEHLCRFRSHGEWFQVSPIRAIESVQAAVAQAHKEAA